MLLPSHDSHLFLWSGFLIWDTECLKSPILIFVNNIQSIQRSIKSRLRDSRAQIGHVHFLHNYPTEGLSLCAIRCTPPRTTSTLMRGGQSLMDRSISGHMEARQNIEMKSGKWDIDNWTHWAPWLALHTICCHLLDLTEWPRKLDWKLNVESHRGCLNL